MSKTYLGIIFMASHIFFVFLFSVLPTPDTLSGKLVFHVWLT